MIVETEKGLYLMDLKHTIVIDESQRQIILLALAHLAVERPGWDVALADIAALMDNVGLPMFEEFKSLRTQNSLLGGPGTCPAAGPSAESSIKTADSASEGRQGNPRA